MDIFMLYALHRRLLQIASMMMIFLCLVFSGPVSGQNNSDQEVYDHPEALQYATTEDRANRLLHFAPSEVNEENRFSLNKAISVDLEDVRLETALQHIADQGDLRLSYSKDVTKREMWDQKVSLQMEDDVTVLGALHAALDNTNLGLKISHHGVLIVHNDEQLEEPLVSRDSEELIVQEQVRGTVTDAETGEALPGVNIIVKGTNIGTSADLSGNYSLNVTSLADTLVFSYIGYQTAEVGIDGRTELDVPLQAQTISREDLIVVGYGTQREEVLTGAISSVSSKVIGHDPVTDISTALRGQAAGVLVTSGGNKPGDEASIRIRGNRSLSANNAPLFVIDGIPISGGIGDFNAQDIESIEVLKDASATAIYGSRGANGVILVTTKSGSVGSTIINYETYTSFSRPYKRVEMMNGQQFLDYKREAYIASGRYTTDSAIFDPIELTMMEQNGWTDYQDELVQTGFANNHNLGVSGGTENTTYNISTNYLNDSGVIPLQDFTRNNLRVNLDHSFGRFRIGTSTFGTYSVRNGESSNPFNAALRLNPLSRPYDEMGNLLLMTTPEASTYNPLTMVVAEQNVDKRTRFRLFSSIYGEVELAENLKYRLNFGPDLSQYRVGSYTGSYTPARREGSAIASSREGFDFDYTMENILTYNRTLAEKHILDFTGLYSVQTSQSETSGINVLGVPTNQMQYYNFNSAEEISGVQSNYEKWSILSGMARVNYNYDYRYLVTVTGRSDGSSRFGSNNKWGFFPSAAFGWVISNEEFMSDNSTWDMLKLRLSYGITGNTGISSYQTLGILSRTAYDFGGSPAFGFSPSRIRNDDLKWEKTSSFNAGLDFAILQGRFSGTLEMYRQNTSDLLMQRQLPQTSGFQSVLENVGKTQNTGIEGMLSGLIHTTNSFSWSMDLNFALNKEEILELYGGKSDDVGNAWFIGEPIHVYYDYEKTGIWQLGEEAEAESYDTRVGQIKIKDQNEDGRIDSEDRMILGSNRPSLSGGITSYFDYERFNLSINMYGSFGNMISSPFHNSHNTLFGRYNNLNVDYWTPDNPTNAYPQPYSDQERPLYNSTMAYFDGSYLKIRNIRLGYNLPQSFANRINVRSMDFYISTQNPFVISPYVQDELGLDPENPTTNTPFTKSFIMGINLSI